MKNIFDPQLDIYFQKTAAHPAVLGFGRAALKRSPKRLPRQRISLQQHKPKPRNISSPSEVAPVAGSSPSIQNSRVIPGGSQLPGGATPVPTPPESGPISSRLGKMKEWFKNNPWAPGVGLAGGHIYLQGGVNENVGNQLESLQDRSALMAENLRLQDLFNQQVQRGWDPQMPGSSYPSNEGLFNWFGRFTPGRFANTGLGESQFDPQLIQDMQNSRAAMTSMMPHIFREQATQEMGRIR